MTSHPDRVTEPLTRVGHALAEAAAGLAGSIDLVAPADGHSHRTTVGSGPTVATVRFTQPDDPLLLLEGRRLPDSLVLAGRCAVETGNETWTGPFAVAGPSVLPIVRALRRIAPANPTHARILADDDPHLASSLRPAELRDLLQVVARFCIDAWQLRDAHCDEPFPVVIRWAVPTDAGVERVDLHLAGEEMLALPPDDRIAPTGTVELTPDVLYAHLTGGAVLPLDQVRSGAIRVTGVWPVLFRLAYDFL